MEVRTAVRFMERLAAVTSNPYFASWSNRRDLETESQGKASRNCSAIQVLVGCRVTLQCRTRRRSWLMMKKHWSTLKVRPKLSDSMFQDRQEIVPGTSKQAGSTRLRSIGRLSPNG